MEESEFFLLKSSITKKLIELFGIAEGELKKHILDKHIEFPGVNTLSGKIFRGENYRSFPYIVLDYPKLFTPQSVFAFRTMFWWGHEFSFTLHLQGLALEQVRGALQNKLNLLNGKEVYFCVGDTPWQYHFEKENYMLIDSISEEIKIGERQFVKLSRKLSVRDHEKFLPFCLETFSLFSNVISGSGTDNMH